MVDTNRRCIECGAALGDASRCEELFQAALAMEWLDPPQTWAAHHLLVGTYMLQHPSGYSAEGQEALVSMIIATVDGELPAAALRERNRGRFEQQARTWRFRAQESAQPILRHWKMTIADVVDGPAEQLPERVWEWARTVREELRPQ
jgi:hypothetical protein